MATVTIAPDEPFVRTGVSWQEYVAFSDALGERHVRLTYDRGTMEFMPLSPEHERAKHLVTVLIGALAEELDIDIAGYGSMTCRREDLERAIEPDEQFWIEHEAQMRGRTEISFPPDPPPDLALEIEITRSVINRLGIYGSLGIPEIWRCDSQTLRVCVRDASGSYVEVPRSRAFPFLPVGELMRFVQMVATMSETKVLRAFRQWVRAQQAQGWPGASA